MKFPSFVSTNILATSSHFPNPFLSCNQPEKLKTQDKHSKNIFVDGHLPPDKVETRTYRIQNAINQLESIHCLNAKNVEIPAHSGQFPPASFLILALISTLSKSSKYKSKLSTIPGEADTFCANAAHGLDKQERCIILTSDSDLLLFEFGTQVDVGLLNSISFQSTEEEEDFHATIALWSPFNVRQILFPDTSHTILDFAWTLLQDPHHTLKAMVGRTKLLAPKYSDDEEYRSFRDQYRLSLPTQVQQRLQDTTPPKEELSEDIKYLDSRIAELVLESSLFSCLKPTPLTAASSPPNIHMYLPILFEDTSRESAWVVSQQWRISAYSLLFPANTTIIEKHRKGKRVGETTCVVPASSNSSSYWTRILTTDWLKTIVMGIAKEYIDKSATQLSKPQILSLVDALSIIFPPASDESSSNQVYEDASSTNRTNKAIKPLSNNTNTTNSKSDKDTWSWFTVHLFAQIQGYIYSLHMLREVASLSGRTSINSSNTKMDATTQVQSSNICKDILQMVPDLSEFPSTLPSISYCLNRKVSKTQSLPAGLQMTAKSILEDVQQYQREEMERMNEMNRDDEDGDEYMGMTIG